MYIKTVKQARLETFSLNIEKNMTIAIIRDKIYFIYVSFHLEFYVI